MRRFAEEYTLDEIGQQAVDQIPWGHIVHCEKQKLAPIAREIS